MTNFQRTVGIVRAIGLLGLIVSHDARAQSELQITSPANNTIVNPGETIAVIVTRSPDIVDVTLVGSLVGGALPVMNGGNPLTFSITIPTQKKAGTYAIAALDVTPRSQLATGVMSAPVTVQVEAANANSIVADPKITLRYPGDKRTLRVFAISANGLSTNISTSSQLSLASSNVAVATVDRMGDVSGVGNGTTTIQVQYNGLSTSVPVTVPTLVRGDLNGDGRIDIDDLNILDSALNRPANGANDARDLNRDGKIDALDARILVTLCTYPQCASHP
jgi:hypothetical protein